MKNEHTAKDTMIDMKTVDDLPPGTSARVKRITAGDAIRQRLMDLGIIEGVEIEMVRSAPFGDPVQIRVMNTLLALRRSEARTLVVDYSGEPSRAKRKRYRHRFGWKSKQR